MNIVCSWEQVITVTSKCCKTPNKAKVEAWIAEPAGDEHSPPLHLSTPEETVFKITQDCKGKLYNYVVWTDRNKCLADVLKHRALPHVSFSSDSENEVCGAVFKLFVELIRVGPYIKSQLHLRPDRLSLSEPEHGPLLSVTHLSCMQRWSYRTGAVWWHREKHRWEWSYRTGAVW